MTGFLQGLLVGLPHAGFTGNFRSPGFGDSVQVNTVINADGTGSIQIDVDKYNPAAAVPIGLLFHGFGQVIPNKLTGTDNTYGCQH